MVANDGWFVYLVRCSDGSFYAGIATDVNERVKRHNWGVGCSYTRMRRPVELVWSEFCGDRSLARAREKQIKSWGQRRKLELLKEARRKPND